MRVTPYTVRTVPELLDLRAASDGEHRAYTFLESGERDTGAVTWAALRDLTVRIAHTIAGCAEPGARVLLLFPPGLEFVPAFFGTLAAGAIAVPAYPPSGGRQESAALRLRGMVSDAGVSMVLTTAAVAARRDAVCAIAPHLASVPWLDVADAAAAPAASVAIRRSDIALLQYTSGSTSSPRGVMVTHANLLDNLGCSARLARHDAASASVSWLPVNHDMGLIEGVLQPAFSGFPAYLMAPVAFLQRPLRWLDAISRYAATHSGAPNFAYDLCVRRTSAPERARLDLSRWRIAFNGSEPIRPDTVRAFCEAFASTGFRAEAMRPAYGLAEATLLVSTSRPGEAPRTATVDAEGLRRGSAIEAKAGTSVAATTLVASGHAGVGASRVLIVDPVRRTECRPGTVGEIWVAGESVARGYWRRAAETEAIFRARLANGEGPFLRTGDLGFLADGSLFVTGRIKDVLIVRGLKHYPQDLEATIERADAAIRRGCSAAFALETDDGIGVAAEVDDAAASGNSDRVIDRIRAAVSEGHGIRLSLVALLPPGTIPKTTSGKLQRHACRNGVTTGSLGTLALWTDADLLVSSEEKIA
jgi:acyl-CoA synthetase (AMP-forming)/AMP-acid ligase II